MKNDLKDGKVAGLVSREEFEDLKERVKHLEDYRREYRRGYRLDHSCLDERLRLLGFFERPAARGLPIARVLLCSVM